MSAVTLPTIPVAARSLPLSPAVVVEARHRPVLPALKIVLTATLAPSGVGVRVRVRVQHVLNRLVVLVIT